VLDFDPSRPVSTPRAAATVIVVRPLPEGLEVFCVHRHSKSNFLGGAVVFPGGKVDEEDHADAWADLAIGPHPRTVEMATDDADARALAVAACRESLEEAAIVPLSGRISDDEVLAMRAELAGGRSLVDLLRVRRTRLALDSLVPWARWITPEAEARRFDARFFLLPLPEHQRGAHDNHETTMSFWASPAEVLRRFMRGDIFLAPPTCRSLELLAEHTTLESALAVAGEQSLLPVCPRFVADDTAPYLALPGDPSHDVREKRVAGKTRFVLRDGRFVSEDP
jgi:8-oxo-dGTP pyrophosphatase MutT (NUDIX family)